MIQAERGVSDPTEYILLILLLEESVEPCLTVCRLAYPPSDTGDRWTCCHTDFANKDRAHAMGSCPGLTEFLESRAYF